MGERKKGEHRTSKNAFASLRLFGLIITASLSQRRRDRRGGQKYAGFAREKQKDEVNELDFV
jgi:hypothetical protein